MTSEDLRYCAGRGSLVGLQQWLPTEPFDYDWGRAHPQIGCNNIRCSGCGQPVRSTPATEFSRRYQCGCAEYVTSNSTSLADDGEYRGLSAWEYPPPAPWACAGHPALPVPSDLDGIRVSQERLVEVARTGFESPPFVPPGTMGHSIWVSRLFWVLPVSLRAALGEAVAELVLDDDPRVAVRAMRFFTEQRGAPSSERLTAIARDHGAQFATIADPDHPSYTVEDELLTALEYRAFRRDDTGQLMDPEAHELLRRAVRAGKNPNDVIYTFGRLEPDWLAAHAVEIVTSSPNLVGDTVWLLKKLPRELRDNAYRAIANVDAATRAALLERVEAEFVGEERERIVAALE